MFSDPRQLQAAMRKLGISTENIDAIEVVIRCRDRTLRITSPEVIKMKVQGQEVYQIAGRSEVTSGESAAGDEGPSFSEEDVKIVISQTGASREDAIRALKECDGAPAEAIVHLLSKKTKT